MTGSVLQPSGARREAAGWDHSFHAHVQHPRRAPRQLRRTGGHTPATERCLQSSRRNAWAGRCMVQTLCTAWYGTGRRQLGGDALARMRMACRGWSCSRIRGRGATAAGPGNTHRVLALQIVQNSPLNTSGYPRYPSGTVPGTRKCSITRQGGGF